MANTGRKGPLTPRSSIKARGKHVSYICAFHSNKADKRFTIRGLVAFVHAVLAEGNPDITAMYHEERSVYAVINGEIRETTVDAEVHFRNGGTEWWEFKRERDAGPHREGRALVQLQAQAQAAHEEGVRYRILTDSDLRGKEILFDNWLVLSAVIRRAHRYSKARERRRLLDRMLGHGQATVQSLLEEEGCDPALMMAAIAEGLQSGALHADLERALFTVSTLVRRGKS